MFLYPTAQAEEVVIEMAMTLSPAALPLRHLGVVERCGPAGGQAVSILIPHSVFLNSLLSLCHNSLMFAMKRAKYKISLPSLL